MVAVAIAMAIVGACSSFGGTPADTSDEGGVLAEAGTVITPDPDGGNPVITTSDAGDAELPDPEFIDPGFADAGPGCVDFLNETFGTFVEGESNWDEMFSAATSPFIVTPTPFGVSTDPALHIVATSDSTNHGSNAYLAQTFPLPAATFKTVRMVYEFGFNQVEGYAEFGCKMGWTNKPLDDEAVAELRRNNDDGNIYAIVASHEANTNLNDANGLNAALSKSGKFHSIAVSMANEGQNNLHFELSGDGLAALPADFTAPKAFDTLIVGCGVVFGSGPNKTVDVAFRRIRVSHCP